MHAVMKTSDESCANQHENDTEEVQDKMDKDGEVGFSPCDEAEKPLAMGGGACDAERKGGCRT